MRIVVRTSKLALWARRLALFAAAMLVVSAGLRFIGQIAVPVFEISLIIATVTAALAFVTAIAAYIRLWFSGDKGWSPATVGFLLGLLCLAPAGGAAALVQIYPSTADVTTAFDDEPPLMRATPNHPDIDPETVLQSFPNLITRIYQIEPEILFALAQQLVRTSDWEVIAITEPSQIDGRASLNALRQTLMGWENEIVFRIAASSLGAQIDLRAATLEPVYHDLGDNGRAIEAFLLALDGRVSAYLQDNPPIDDDEQFEVIDGGESETQPDPQ